MDLVLQVSRRRQGYLVDRYNAPVAEVLQFFALRGFTLREAAERLGMKYSTIKTQAWELGITFSNGKDAIDRSHRITYNGVEYTTKELSNLSGIPRKTISDRLRYGWTIEQALGEPVRHGNWQHREGKDREVTVNDVQSIWLRKAWKL